MCKNYHRHQAFCVVSSSDMASKTEARLIFPNQLFEEHFKAKKNVQFFLIEDDLFFRQYAFHKQKLLLHHLSMSNFATRLKDAGYEVSYISTSATEKSMDQLSEQLSKHKIKTVSYFDLVDNWLQTRLSKMLATSKIEAEAIDTPSFLTTNAQLDEYFKENKNRMQQFYIWQRKRLSVMVDSKDKPEGGKWNFDVDNRKKLPKNHEVPPAYAFEKSSEVDQSIQWVEKTFPDNPGNADSFCFAHTHELARKILHSFIHQRLETFGPYEDAISIEHTQMYHSVLSPYINVGLLTPQEVVDAVVKYSSTHTIPIESLEGFLRQVIGWREYMRATYVQYGNTMRTDNRLKHTKKLSKGWWDGTTGLDPVDHVITNILDTAYAHHIERLMVLGNAMTLLRIHPDQVYEWFMELFIDAYDWVMVPNVYAMSQFAAGEMITTKPYVSGSNYILKMSDHKKGDWSPIWDALYWQFIADNFDSFKRNMRMSMVTRIYDNFDDEKKKDVKKVAEKFIS